MESRHQQYFKIDLLDNPDRLPLRRQIQAGPFNPVNIIPRPSPTLGQLKDSTFIISEEMASLETSMLEDIFRQTETHIFSHRFNQQGDHDQNINAIKKILTENPTRIKKTVLNFIKLNLLKQTTILFSTKETIVERLQLKNINWIPLNLEGIASILKLEVSEKMNEPTFSVYFQNGIAFGTTPEIPPQISGVYQQKITFSLLDPGFVERKYVNWPIRPLKELLYTTDINAEFFMPTRQFSDEMKRLGFTVNPVSEDADLDESLTKNLQKLISSGSRCSSPIKQ